MEKRKKKEHDFSVIAFRVVQEATGQIEPKPKPVFDAVGMGRRGGLKGGKARAAILTPEQRRDIAGKAARKRWAAPLYDEAKATQAAALLIEMNGGTMDYLTCIKALYSIEKEALNRWLRPVTYDDLYSMKHGQAVSQTIDRAEYRKRKPKSFWSEHIETSPDNTLTLISQVGKDRLSRAEVTLIEEIGRIYKEKTLDQILTEFHDPKLFPEWKDPHGSSLRTSYRELLRVLGKTDAEIEEFEEEIGELARLRTAR